MKVLIVEDQEYQAKMLEALLQKHDSTIEIMNILCSIQETIEYLKSEDAPDLILMDVELKDGYCFDIFDEITVTSPVIFTTNHTNYSLEAFYTTGIHYLIKPITKARLEEGLEKYYQLQQQLGKSMDAGPKEVEVLDDSKPELNRKLLIKVGNKQVPFQMNDIALFIINDGLVYLINKDQKRFLVDYNLDELITKLNPDVFFRLNRQVIVNIEVIASFYTYTRGRLKVDLTPFVDEPIVLSFKTRGTFLGWINKNLQ